MEEASNVTYEEGFAVPGLPKWPAFVVQGKKVEPELAAEILIRTDIYLPDYTYGSNDKDFCRAINGLFGIPVERDGDNVMEYFNRVDRLRDRLNKIPLEYLANARIASSWVGGPHGWIDWNGNVFCHNSNIGKWPSVEAVAEEWAVIAEAFPQLDLVCQLHSAEAGFGEAWDGPVVEFVVKDGQVVVRAPQTPMVEPINELFSNVVSLFTPGRERGTHINHLRAELERIYGNIPQFADMPTTAPWNDEEEAEPAGESGSV